MTHTIIDRDFIEQAVDQTGTELIDEYGEMGCFALEGELRDVIEFFMHLAQHDHALGVNLADVMRGDLVIWWFPGFKLEPIPGSHDDPGSKWEVESEMLGRAESDRILEDELRHPEDDDPFRGSDV